MASQSDGSASQTHKLEKITKSEFITIERFRF